MASCQSTDANGAKTSFPNTTPTGGDVCSFAENATILISTPLTVIALDVLSNDLAGIALCSIANEFSPSTDMNSASADCQDPSDIRYPADSRSLALSVCTNVIGPNANSSDPGAQPRIKPFVGEGELARIGLQFLSDNLVSGATAPAIPMSDNNNNKGDRGGAWQPPLAQAATTIWSAAAATTCCQEGRETIA
ncbi:hypothetical protein [Mesorhizobium sp. WSM1497]|uniref:hypothetical protein n=1 Tax=Mesorhizobium sp. WSM1497 TaxID=278153 RepID=UPI0012FAD3BF|nr:hypothetical protein [Mesorhizobium sp. WSM1497]